MGDGRKQSERMSLLSAGEDCCCALWDLLKNLHVLTNERNPSCAATANQSAALINIAPQEKNTQSSRKSCYNHKKRVFVHFQLSACLNPTEGGGECKVCMTQRHTADTQQTHSRLKIRSTQWVSQQISLGEYSPTRSPKSI